MRCSPVNVQLVNALYGSNVQDELAKRGGSDVYFPFLAIETSVWLKLFSNMFYINITEHLLFVKREKRI